MPGPDLRVNTRPMGVAPMGPPIISSGAPVVTPHVPSMSHGAPTMYPSQVAAEAVNYNMLRGYAQTAQSSPCKGCGPDGPSLRDIAPPNVFARAPMWMKIAGALAGFGIVIGAIVYFVRR